jgi:hypothetical protein
MFLARFSPVEGQYSLVQEVVEVEGSYFLSNILEIAANELVQGERQLEIEYVGSEDVVMVRESKRFRISDSAMRPLADDVRRGPV